MSKKTITLECCGPRHTAACGHQYRLWILRRF
jgi:hypothetical protein